MAEDVTEISSFLLMVLEERNDLPQQNSTTEEFKDKVTTYFELLEVITKMLEAFYEVSENKDDKLCWENLASQYRLIFIAFHNTLLQSQSHQSYFVVKVIKRQMDSRADQNTIFQRKLWKSFMELVFRGRKFRKYLEFRKHFWIFNYK